MSVLITLFHFLNYISSFYLVDACNVKWPSSLHATCSCLLELPDFPSHRSLRVYIHREFFFLSLLITHFFDFIFFEIFQSSSTATATGTRASGAGGSGSGSGSGATSTSTSTQSSAISSIGVPPAFYALSLGIMAGVALVL